MVRRIRFKPNLREQKQQNLAAEKYYATFAPMDKMAAAAERVQTLEAAIKPVRERAAARQLEAPVVAAISELLSVHPKVALGVRQNSGMASYEAKSGRYAPVFFYKLLTHGSVMTITDFWGLLKDGRMYAFEAKAPGFREPRTDRERKQANFIALVRNCGGIGEFVTSVDQVAEALR